MKFSLYAGVLALLAITTATATGLQSFHRDQPTMEDVRALVSGGAGDRKLEIDEFINFWIVSFISEEEAWCITAAEGTKEFGNLKLQQCDFTGTSKNQLWYIPFDSEELQIRSALDDSKCITVNHGNNIFEGVRARLSDCENGLTTFYGDGHIHVADDPSFCLTNRGPKPHPSDWIHAKTCTDRADFFWIPIPNIPYHVQLTAGGGCAQPRDTGRRVFLDECEEEMAWRVAPIDFLGEAALIHSGLDDNKCLRAGIGSRIRDGTRMAVVDCDPEDPLQHFVYDGEVKVAGRAGLCMVYRGTTPHVGRDPIIMKKCRPSQEEWELIELFPEPPTVPPTDPPLLHQCTEIAVDGGFCEYRATFVELQSSSDCRDGYELLKTDEGRFQITRIDCLDYSTRTKNIRVSEEGLVTLSMSPDVDVSCEELMRDRYLLVNGTEPSGTIWFNDGCTRFGTSLIGYVRENNIPYDP